MRVTKFSSFTSPDKVLNHGQSGERYLTRWNLRHKFGLLVQWLMLALPYRVWTAIQMPRRLTAWGWQQEKHYTSRSILLHHIAGPDPDGALHNHPWPAFAIILWGGYEQLVAREITDHEIAGFWEEKLDKVRFLNILRTNQYHRIVKVKPNTWTLTFTGRRLPRGWGFLVHHFHMDHKEYLGTTQDDI